jgi:hypothetical protein
MNYEVTGCNCTRTSVTYSFVLVTAVKSRLSRRIQCSPQTKKKYRFWWENFTKPTLERQKHQLEESIKKCISGKKFTKWSADWMVSESHLVAEFFVCGAEHAGTSIRTLVRNPLLPSTTLAVLGTTAGCVPRSAPKNSEKFYDVSVVSQPQKVDKKLTA